MKKITSLLCLALFSSFALQAQEKLSANVELGLGIPFVDLNQNTYAGYKPNLGVNAGVGYLYNPNTRFRLDIVGVQLNGNDDAAYFQAQFYEGSVSAEYNLLSLFDKNPKYKLNARGGVGAGIHNGVLYDINTRDKITEVPAQQPGGTNFSINTFVLLGLNVGIPVSDKIDLNIGYGHRVLWFQPWLDVFNSESFDTWGLLSVGAHYTLKSDRDPSKIEVDPKKYNNLKAKADSSDTFAAQADRNAEKVGRLEMSNQEKDMQIAMLTSQMESLKANPMVKTVSANQTKSSKGSESNQGGSDEGSIESDSDLGPAQYRVIVVSSPTRRGAERFIERSKLVSDNMKIAYIERLETFRVIYKSTANYAEAKQYRDEARQYYSDAWITKF